MIQYTFKGGADVALLFAGKPAQLAAEALFLIHWLYFSAEDPQEAETFRALIQAGTQAEAPTWQQPEMEE